MRDEPQGLVREPLSEGGPADVRALRESAETGAACEALDVETSQGDELCALGGRAAIADGRQAGRGRGGPMRGSCSSSW